MVISDAINDSSFMPTHAETDCVRSEKLIQPFAAVPITTYVVVIVGEIMIVDVACVVLHMYDEAPLADKVAVSPAQINVDVEIVVIVGIGAVLLNNTLTLFGM